MSPTIGVGLALSTRRWRGAFQRHCRDHEADLTVTLVRDTFDLTPGVLDVVCVDDDTSWLSVPAMDRCREAGIAVVGLFDPGDADGHGRLHLDRLGVDRVESSEIGIDALVELVRRAVPGGDDRTAVFRSVVDEIDPEVAPDHRRLLAVGGPAGAGATEVAIAVAQGWGGGRPLVIDLDDTTPSIAGRLGLAIHPHVVTALEVVRRGGRHGFGSFDERHRTIESCLARSAAGSNAVLPFDTIVGLASRDDWDLLRPDDVGDLLHQLRARWPLVVAKVGPILEDLGRQTPRFEVGRAAVRLADHVVGVCGGHPGGLLRFVDWLIDVTAVAGETPIDVVLNRAPSAADRRVQLVDELRSMVGDRVGEIVILPVDRRVERAAWDAAPVARGPFRRELGRLNLEARMETQ